MLTKELPIYAKNYGGGFSGLARDAEIKGTLDTGLGINLAETLLSLQPQSTLVDCTISDCEYQVSGENCLGGFVGAMANSYAVDCTINCPDDPLTVSGSNYIGGRGTRQSDSALRLLRRERRTHSARRRVFAGKNRRRKDNGFFRNLYDARAI